MRDGKARIHSRLQQLSLLIPQQQSRETGRGKLEMPVSQARSPVEILFLETYPHQILAGGTAGHRQIQRNSCQGRQNGFKTPGKDHTLRFRQLSGRLHDEMIRFIHTQLLRLLHGFHQQETGNNHPLRPGSIPIRLQGNVPSAGIPLHRRILSPHIRIRERPARLYPFQNIFLVGSGKNILGNSHHATILKLQINLRITDGHQHGYDGSAPVIRPNARPGASRQAQPCQYGQNLYR